LIYQKLKTEFGDKKKYKFFRILLNIGRLESFSDFVIDIGFVRGTSSCPRSDARLLFVEIDIDSLFIKIGVEVRKLTELI